MCFNELNNNNFHELIHSEINICPKCLKELNPKRTSIKVNGIKGEYLFTYSDKMREKIYTLKGCGDIELAKVFLNYFKRELKGLYHGYYLVSVPSDKESDSKRGFNHVIEIYKCLNLPFLNVIQKRFTYKQSDLDKKEREMVKNKLMIANPDILYHKKILLVDDVMTTGSTIKACLDLLKQCKPKKLRFMVIAKVLPDSSN